MVSVWEDTYLLCMGYTVHEMSSTSNSGGLLRVASAHMHLSDNFMLMVLRHE